jgi:hypothetical protein
MHPAGANPKPEDSGYGELGNQLLVCHIFAWALPLSSAFALTHVHTYSLPKVYPFFLPPRALRRREFRKLPQLQLHPKRHHHVFCDHSAELQSRQTWGRGLI